MIDREHELPVTRQAALLKLSRSSLYYRARPVAPADLAVRRRIDELHLDYPFAGSRMLRDLLRGAPGIRRRRQRRRPTRLRPSSTSWTSLTRGGVPGSVASPASASSVS